jgi:hypothetical protein
MSPLSLGSKNKTSKKLATLLATCFQAGFLLGLQSNSGHVRVYTPISAFLVSLCSPVKAEALRFPIQKALLIIY